MRPDIAIITVGVTAQAPTAADAQSQTAERVARILERAKQLGIAARTRRTAATDPAAVRIRPEPGPEDHRLPGDPTGRPHVPEGRRRGRKALDTLVQNEGATNASLQFAIEDPKAAQADAQTRAIADARAKAQAMADAAGVRLGAAISVSDQSMGPNVLDSAKFSPHPGQRPRHRHPRDRAVRDRLAVGPRPERRRVVRRERALEVVPHERADERERLLARAGSWPGISPRSRFARVNAASPQSTTRPVSARSTTSD